VKLFDYNYPYHQMLVYKIMNARIPDRTYVTFEESLDMIHKADRLTRGMRQIVYLTGWQYLGHDSRYPAWFEGNQRLKRAENEDPLDSLRWLMKEAKERYNAIVSVHINMCDAYEDSPLWEEYVKADVLERLQDGSLRRGGIWDGQQSYLVSKTLEWRSGLAKKRIDRFLELLPIEEAGTVHIDVFTPRDSPYHGITLQDDIESMKEIIAYFKSRGIDITKEWFDKDFLGYIPMVWHFTRDENSRLEETPEQVCGGGSGWNKRNKRFIVEREAEKWYTGDRGCLYEEAWGHSVDLEPLGSEGEYPFTKFVEDVYLKTMPWYFLNRYRALGYSHFLEEYAVTFEGGVVSRLRTADRHLTISQGEFVLVEGTDILVPVLWTDRQELISFSKEGGKRSWKLPEDWADVREVKVETIYPFESGESRMLAVRGGCLDLELAPMQAVFIQPSA